MLWKPLFIRPVSYTHLDVYKRQDLASGQVQLLSEGSQDESPSFAPNGRVILYATRAGGRGALAAVSADGRVKQRLNESGGDIREPAWGPLIK